MRFPALLMVPWVLVVACGGSAKPAEAPNPEPTEASSAEAEKPESAATEEKASGPMEMPSKCFKADGTCTPSPKFVSKLCGGSFPSVALYLFMKDLPFTRGYLTRKTEAMNASGGASAGGYLEFDEEVLVVAERKADAGGMQVSGAGGGYDVLRWDGTCSTLSSEELTTNRAPAPKYAKVVWRFLDDNVQEELRKDEKVDKAVSTRKKECKGATMGDVSLKCVQADEKLSQSIIDYVHKGGTIPVPTKSP